MNVQDHGAKPSPAAVNVTIDGRAYRLEDKHQTATGLLTLAGVSPEGYDLTRVKAHGHTETFRDDQKITVHEGDVYVTVNQQGTVA